MRSLPISARLRTPRAVASRSRARFRNGLRLIDARVRPGALVLAYHRVAEPRLDPWGNAVSPARFAEQMAVVARAARAISLSELADAVGSGTVPARAVAVTFDDGYRDNLAVALPILEGLGIPATFFVIAGGVGARRRFWWDDLDLLLSDGPAPATLRLRIDGRDREWDLSGPSVTPVPWRADDPPPTPRHALYRELWGLLRRRPESVQQDVISQLRSAWPSPIAAPDPEALPLDHAELRRLADSDGVEIGSHTMSHPHLPALAPAERSRELRASRAALSDATGRDITALSFPYGAFDAECAREARAAGYRSASTMAGVPVRGGVDRWAVPRVMVGDWDGQEFERRLMWRLAR